MRIHLTWISATVFLLGVAPSCVKAQTAAKPTANKPLLSTGITGSIRASGLDDPQYVLSFVPIQALMLRAARHPVTKDEIAKALQGTPVSMRCLLQLQLLRRDDNLYRLNYLLLTAQDQQKMYAVADRYGRSLAEAFLAHRGEFDEILRRYPSAALRPQLMFDLVAGAALNWQGLELTTQLGYRVHPPRHTNGDVYFVHSDELGANLDFTGLYLDSETAPGTRMSFTTFGDGPSLPRLEGLPDVFDGVESAVAPWRKQPALYEALRSEYIALVLLAVDDAGQVMNAVAHGTNTDATLVQLSIPENRRNAILHLLTSIGYLERSGQRYVIAVPVLTRTDRPLVEATLKLTRDIMSAWLRRNYAPMKHELSDLLPMRNGLPFSLVFSEVWHYEFGFATKTLAEDGFYANPRQRRNRYKGYVPLVWENSLLKGPGN